MISIYFWEQKWFALLIIFIMTLILCQINLPLFNDIRIIPDYFIAFIVSAIIVRLKKLNIFNIFLLGIFVDILIGELIGQYSLIFLCVFMGNFVLHKFFTFKSPSQIIFLYFILLELGFVILTTTSLSYELKNNNIDILIYKNILTIPACVVYKLLFEKININ